MTLVSQSDINEVCLGDNPASAVIKGSSSVVWSRLEVKVFRTSGSYRIPDWATGVALVLAGGGGGGAAGVGAGVHGDAGSAGSVKTLFSVVKPGSSRSLVFYIGSGGAPGDDVDFAPPTYQFFGKPGKPGGATTVSGFVAGSASGGAGGVGHVRPPDPDSWKAQPFNFVPIPADMQSRFNGARFIPMQGVCGGGAGGCGDSVVAGSPGLSGFIIAYFWGYMT